MQKLFFIALAGAFLVFDWSAASAAAPAKKEAPKSASAKASPAKKTPAKSGKKSSSRTAPRAAWRTRQMAPSPERYKEIQEALASKGYLKAENATGVWSADSADALKRFQTDQNIEANGKINSLSLIALGLGPKHDTPSTARPPAPPAVQQDLSGFR